MKAQDLKSKLAALNGKVNVTSVEFLILGEPKGETLKNGGVSVFKARMHRDMPAEFASLFLPKLKDTFVKRDHEMLAYDPAVTPDRKVLWTFPVSKVPFIKTIIAAFDSTKTPYYDDEILGYGEIQALWLRMIINDDSYLIGKKVTNSKVIESGWGMAVVFKGETFNHLKEDVLTIDDHIDILVCFEMFIFENKQNFEKLMDYDDVLQKTASATLSEIQKLDVVQNFDQLANMLADDQPSIRKLNKLKEKDYFKHKSFGDYQKIIKDYGINVGVDLKAKQFVIADKAQAKLLIKVFNDDYLRSDLTNLKYSANSKESI